MPVDIHKLDENTYAIEMMADVLSSENNMFIFLIFLINFDSSIETDQMYITNIRKSEDKTSVYNKLISGKTKDNTFFLDWKLEYDESSGFYYTDLASKEHKGIIEDRLYATKNMFLQTCIFLYELNNKENPKVCLNILSDDEYKSIKKSESTAFLDYNDTTYFKIAYNDTLYIIFKTDCIRYIEINKRRIQDNGKAENS